jgi:tripartite-type tricarboxylate transporter receptor subunit TctC
VHLYVSPTLTVLPQYKAGRLRVLGVTSAERLAAAPEIPTLAEKGLSFLRFGWLGVCGGAGMPQPVITLLNQQVGAIVKSPEYRDLIEKAGSVALSSTPEELSQILHQTYDQTARIAREFGLQLD